MKSVIKQPASTYVEEIPGGMGLMNPGIKPLHCERKIHGIQVIQVMTSKHETSDGNRARPKHEKHLLPVSHAYD